MDPGGVVSAKQCFHLYQVLQYQKFDPLVLFMFLWFLLLKRGKLPVAVISVAPRVERCAVIRDVLLSILILFPQWLHIVVSLI